MNQHHDDIRALGPQLRDQRVGGQRLARERQALDPAGTHHMRCVPERHADKAHTYAQTILLEELHARRRKQRLAVVAKRIGRQISKVGPFERLAELAGLFGREFLATAVLHAQQLGIALVVFMIAGGGKVHLHQIQRFDGRLIEKQRRHNG